MIELSLLVYAMTGFFAYIGFNRSLSKELISLSGVILGLFTLHQFDTLIRQTLLAGLSVSQVFFVQCIIFLVIVFFAYQTRVKIGGGTGGRDPLQAKVLGAIVGGVNGYLISGTIWYFLDINRTSANTYPLDPFITAPVVGSVSAQTVSNLPLYVLAQGPGSNGDLLSLAVIVLFVIVLVVI